MKQDRIIKALTAAGLADVSPVKLTEDRRGLMVHHDYSGPYPTAEALHLAQAARRVADRFGLRSEARGHKSATLIYLA